MVTPMKHPDFHRLCRDTFALMGEHFDTPAARAMLWAIGRQEGRMHYRRQIGGPARGLYQFERGGGVRGVLTHPASKDHARALCDCRAIRPTSQAVYSALEHDDILATGFARLLLWTDPQALPEPSRDSVHDAWKYYLRNWRPGRPHPSTWADFWSEAVEMVK